jgi:hypothetical protein
MLQRVEALETEAQKFADVAHALRLLAEHSVRPSVYTEADIYNLIQRLDAW